MEYIKQPYRTGPVFLDEWVKTNSPSKRFHAGKPCSICQRLTCATVWYSTKTEEVRCTGCFDPTTTKRYFGVVWPVSRAAKAALLSGYERDGKVLRGKNSLGFALDYYPDEKRRYERELGKSIVGDFPTRKTAEAAIAAALQGRP